jgi:hypothetical protein
VVFTNGFNPISASRSRMRQRYGRQRFERALLSGVEIEEHELGFVERRNARRPDVQDDRRQVCEIDEARFVVAERKGDLAARSSGRRNGHPLDPLRHAARHLLLEEGFAVDAIRIALKRERPVLQVRNGR